MIYDHTFFIHIWNLIANKLYFIRFNDRTMNLDAYRNKKNELEFIDCTLRLSNATFSNTFNICVISMSYQYHPKK